MDLDLDIVALATVTATILAAIGLVPATLSWWETRRQRLGAHRGANDKQQEVENVAVSTVWRCGLYDYPPLSLFPGASAPSGPLAELAIEVLARLEQPFQFVPFAYRDFYAGSSKLPDIVVGMFQTERRSEHMAFSRPVYEIGLQGLCRIDQDGDVLEGLREGTLRVAVYSGEVGWEFVHDELPDVVEQSRVAEVGGGHQQDTTGLLTQGLYDVVLMDELACRNFLGRGNNHRKFRLAFKQPLKTFNTCIAVRRDHAEKLTEVNKIIEEVRNRGGFIALENIALAGFESVVAKRALRTRASRTPA